MDSLDILDLKLQIVFEYLPFGMIILDENGIIQTVNPVLKEKLTTGSTNLYGKNFLEWVQSKDEDIFEELLAGCKTGKLQTRDIEISGKHNHIHNINLICIKHDKSNAVVILGISGGITQHSDLEKKLEDEAELNEMKSRFLSIASHEFRTPLAGIMSSLNLMKRYLDASGQGSSGIQNKEKINRHIVKINDLVKNLTSILNNFLALGNIEKGEIPVRFTKVDVKKTIMDRKSMFEQICKTGQEIFYTHSGKKVTAVLDHYLLRNIINNLISNAVKYSPEYSEIHIHSEITEHAEFKLTVTDQGIGIPENDQKNIFMRFYRAKNALAYEDGTGLGLNIVKSYVDLMKGAISVESEENRGTTVCITIPKIEP
jgi:PAS domain S-box-containing protein